MDENTFSKANISKTSKQEHSSQASRIPMSIFATQSSQQSASTTNETSNMQQTTNRMNTEFLVGMEQKNSSLVYMQTNSLAFDKPNEHRTTNSSKESVESYVNQLPENKPSDIRTLSSVNENTEATTKDGLPTPFSVAVTNDSTERLNSLSVNRSMAGNTVTEEQPFDTRLVNPTADLLETVPATKEMLTEEFQITKEQLPKAQSFTENPLNQNSEVLLGEFSRIEKDTLIQTGIETKDKASASISTIDSSSPDVSLPNPLNATSDKFMGEMKPVEKNIWEQPLKDEAEIAQSDELPTSELPMTDSLFLNRLKPMSDNFLGADTTEESIVAQPINSGELEAPDELLTSVFKTKQTVSASELVLDESSVIEKLSEKQILNTDLENGIDEAVVLKNRTIDSAIDLPKVTQSVTEPTPSKSSNILVEKVLSKEVASAEIVYQAPIIEKIEDADNQQVPVVIEEVPETAKKTAAILNKSIPVDQEISKPNATNRVEVQSEQQSIPIENENVEPTDQVHSTTKTESTDKSITPKFVGNSEVVTTPSTTIPVREVGTIALDVPKIQSGHGPTLEKVVQEIAKPIQQELQTMVQPNEKVVTFDLDPGDLGKIQVKMKVTAQSVSLELTVQSEQTKKMFEAITTRLDKV